jgi:uncharacterized membrane protein YfcA
MLASLLIATVAFLVAGLTLFSGFGLGTLLMPAFALFFPVPLAIAATAAVHLANNLFKLVLVGRDADLSVVLRFGVPAVVAAFAGAGLLGELGELPPVARYTVAGREAIVEPVALVIGSLIVTFALIELHPVAERWRVGRRLLPLGGLLSGFFGGLSGNQGAFRSAFLVKAGLEPRAFIGTSVVIAVLVDLARLAVYGTAVRGATDALANPDMTRLVGTAIGAAFLGSYLGSRLVRKVTLGTLQRIVAVLLVLVGLGLATGLL